MIVATAAQVIDAQAASLFLLDEQAGDLVFEIAIGGRAAEVKRVRVPVGHGIAGLVALTGHAMATAGSDSRQATDIADRVGYHPQAILCVPLFYQERVIGVLELLDKKNGRPFDHRDMELLGLFATHAAVAIEQSRTRDQIASLVLHALGVASREGRSGVEDAARAMTNAVTDDTSYRAAIAIARLAHQITLYGNREAKLVTATLEAFVEYLRSRPRSEQPY
jgi:GAF domain-containing protein